MLSSRVKDLRLNPKSSPPDVVEFGAASLPGRWSARSRCTEGPFLDGFIFGAGEFERWTRAGTADSGRSTAICWSSLAGAQPLPAIIAPPVGWLKKLAGLRSLNASVAVALMQATWLRRPGRGPSAREGLRGPAPAGSLISRRIAKSSPLPRNCVRSPGAIRAQAGGRASRCARCSGTDSPGEPAAKGLRLQAHQRVGSNECCRAGPKSRQQYPRRRIMSRKCGFPWRWSPWRARHCSGVGWVAGRHLMSGRGAATSQASALTSSAAPTRSRSVGSPTTPSSEETGRGTCPPTCFRHQPRPAPAGSGGEQCQDVRAASPARDRGDTAAVVVEAARKAGAG